MTGVGRDRLRVHLRSLTLRATTYQILTLRRSDPVRFSVETSHEFRMIRSDLAGVHRLARLLWALSYQRRPGTLLALDRAHLVANRDGSPSTPVVFYVHPRSTLGASDLKALHRWLCRPSACERTVTMQTPSYDLTQAEIDAWQSQPHPRSNFPPQWHGRNVPPSRVDTVHGLVVIAGSRMTMRGWSLCIGRLHGSWYAGEDCAEPDGKMRLDVHAVDQFSRR